MTVRKSILTAIVSDNFISGTIRSVDFGSVLLVAIQWDYTIGHCTAGEKKWSCDLSNRQILTHGESIGRLPDHVFGTRFYETDQIMFAGNQYALKQSNQHTELSRYSNSKDEFVACWGRSFFGWNAFFSRRIFQFSTPLKLEELPLIVSFTLDQATDFN